MNIRIDIDEMLLLADIDRLQNQKIAITKLLLVKLSMKASIKHISGTEAVVCTWRSQMINMVPAGTNDDIICSMCHISVDS